MNIFYEKIKTSVKQKRRLLNSIVLLTAANSLWAIPSNDELTQKQTPIKAKAATVDRSYVKRESVDKDTIQIEHYDIGGYYAKAPGLLNEGFRAEGDTAGVIAITNGFGVRTNDTKENWTEFAVGKITAGKYKLSIRYTNGYDGVAISQYDGVGGKLVMTKTINFPVNLGWENYDVRVDTVALKGGENQVIRLKHFAWAVIDWMKFDLIEADPDPSMNFVGVDFKTDTVGLSNLAEMLPPGTIWNRHEGQGTSINLSVINRTEAPAGYRLTNKVLKVDAKAITRWWDGLMFEFAKEVTVHSTRKYLHIAYFLPAKSTLENGVIKNWLKTRGVETNAWANEAGVQPVIGRWTDLIFEVKDLTAKTLTHFEFMGIPENAISYIGSIEFTDSPKPRFLNYPENYKAVDFNNYKLIPNVGDPNPAAAPGTIWNRNASAGTVVNLEIVHKSISPKGYDLTDSVLKVNAQTIEAWWHGLMLRFKQPVTYNPAKRFFHVAYYLPALNGMENSQVRNWLKLVNSPTASSAIWNNAPTGFIPKVGKWVDGVIEVKAEQIAITDSSYSLSFNHFEFFGVPANMVSYIGSIEFTDSAEPRFVNQGVAISKTRLSDITTFANNGNIYINGLKNEFVQIFDLTGKIVFANSGNNSEMKIPVAQSGLYIVKAGSNVFKVQVSK